MVSEARSREGISPVFVVVAAVVIAALGFLLYFASKPKEVQAPSVISAEGKAYVSSLKLSGVEMKATSNFAGAAVIEILGNITNAGTRTLNRVELTCVFYDVSGLVVLRPRVPIVRSAIKPGETRSFRLPFEDVPTSWNQTLPQLVIAQIDFAD